MLFNPLCSLADPLAFFCSGRTNKRNTDSQMYKTPPPLQYAQHPKASKPLFFPPQTFLPPLLRFSSFSLLLA